MSKKSNADSFKWTLVIILIVAGAITGYTLIKNQVTEGKIKADKQQAIDSIMENVTQEFDSIAEPIDTTPIVVDTQPTPATIPSDTTKPTAEALPVEERVIVLASLANQESANKALADYQKQGFKVRTIEAMVKEKKYYRICIYGIGSQDKVKTTLDSLKQIPQFKDAWMMWAWNQ